MQLSGIISWKLLIMDLFTGQRSRSGEICHRVFVTGGEWTVFQIKVWVRDGATRRRPAREDSNSFKFFVLRQFAESCQDLASARVGCRTLGACVRCPRTTTVACRSAPTEEIGGRIFPFILFLHPTS